MPGGSADPPDELRMQECALARPPVFGELCDAGLTGGGWAPAPRPGPTASNHTRHLWQPEGGPPKPQSPRAHGLQITGEQKTNLLAKLFFWLACDSEAVGLGSGSGILFSLSQAPAPPGPTASKGHASKKNKTFWPARLPWPGPPRPPSGSLKEAHGLQITREQKQKKLIPAQLKLFHCPRF